MRILAIAVKSRPLSPRPDDVLFALAFAAVAVASGHVFGIAPNRIHANGGAIALCHPIGMSGARLVIH